ncbi:hypothetical protein CRENBAI_020345 [Crenichthys baileyi]|uniref:Uncharacterized protein n=1 Tax=Crenichthys baileyi TaxID=28760 RepID=A0AAV9R7D5_9TELE
MEDSSPLLSGSFREERRSVGSSCSVVQADQPQKQKVQKGVDTVVEGLVCYNSASKEHPESFVPSSRLDSQLKDKQCYVALCHNSFHQKTDNFPTLSDNGTVVHQGKTHVTRPQPEVNEVKHSCSDMSLDLPAGNSLVPILEAEHSVKNSENSKKDLKAIEEYTALISSEEVTDTMNLLGDLQSPGLLNPLTAEELKCLSIAELESEMKPDLIDDLIYCPVLHASPLLPLSPSSSTTCSHQHLLPQSNFHAEACEGVAECSLKPDGHKPNSQRLVAHCKSFPRSKFTRTSSISAKLLGPSVTVTGLTHLPERPKSLKPSVSPLALSFSLLNGTRLRTDSQSHICLYGTGSISQMKVTQNNGCPASQPRQRTLLDMEDENKASVFHSGSAGSWVDTDTEVSSEHNRPFWEMSLQNHCFSQSTPTGLDCLGWTKHVSSFWVGLLSSGCSSFSAQSDSQCRRT